jgi:hypothetical protein
MTVQSTVPNKYTWEVGPLKLLKVPITNPDKRNRAVTYTALIYNCLIRALNSIYHQTPHIPCSHYAIFVDYSLSVYYALLDVFSGDSELDEKIWRYVPERNYTPRLLPANWGYYLETIRDGKDTFDPATCKSLLRDFFPRLNSHLAKQIDNYSNFDDISERSLEVSEVDVDFVALADEQIRRTVKCLARGDKKHVFWAHHDSTGHMDLPLEFSSSFGILKWLGKKREVWQFSSCDSGGKPRELKFLGKKG